MTKCLDCIQVSLTIQYEIKHMYMHTWLSTTMVYSLLGALVSYFTYAPTSYSALGPLKSLRTVFHIYSKLAKQTECYTL